MVRRLGFHLKEASSRGEGVRSTLLQSMFSVKQRSGTTSTFPTTTTATTTTTTTTTMSGQAMVRVVLMERSKGLARVTSTAQDLEVAMARGL